MPRTLPPPPVAAPAPPPPAPTGPDPNAPPAVLPRMTREAYLAFDGAATAGFKYEWIDGRVRTMSGGTFNHHQVGSNVVAVLDAALRAARVPGRPKLRAGGSDLRTRVPGGPYYYPDAIVKPVPPRIEEPPDEPQRTLLNPALLAEVLSRTTAATDRGEKRREYLKIPSLEYYLIVQPNVRHVLRLARDGGRWRETAVRGGDLELPRLGVAVSLDDLYEDCLPGGDRF